MKRHVLLASVGAAALALVPAAASAQFFDGVTVIDNADLDQYVDIKIDYENEIEADIDTEVEFEKEVRLHGSVELDGDIDVDSGVIAVSDTKQLVEDSTVVEFDELFQDHDDENSVIGFDVAVDGNVGVNVAAGSFNMQANVAVLASGDNTDAWSEASTTALQKLLDVSYTGGVDNTVDGGPILDSAGNVGVNLAAGAFNIQENLLTLASVTDSSLAEATAAVLQVSVGNRALNFITDNEVNLGDISGAGNIGVNAAAGVGNVQHNSLTAASALNLTN